MKAPRDVVGVAGGSIELSCRVGGEPKPRLMWRKAGGGMPVSRAKIITDSGLRVSPLRPEDEGVYVCEASNRASVVTANASLIVHSKC